MTPDDWIEIFGRLDLGELALVQGALITVLAEKTHIDVYARMYNDLRLAFAEVDGITANQLMFMKYWQGLSKANRTKFTKSVRVALNYLLGLGFPEDDKTYRLIVRLVSHNPIFKQGLKFDYVLMSLDSIDVLFNSGFPGYVKNGALQELLKII